MRVVREKAAFAALSELRTHPDRIIAQLKETFVILEKHNKPVAVLEDPKRYEAMQQMLELATDLVLAFEARTRELSASKNDYIPWNNIVYKDRK